MNPRLVLSVILLLVATIVISTGFTASATEYRGPHVPNPDRFANSTQNQWTQTYQQYYQQQTFCLCNPNDPNCSCRPHYPNYPNYYRTILTIPTILVFAIQTIRTVFVVQTIRTMATIRTLQTIRTTIPTQATAMELQLRL